MEGGAGQGHVETARAAVERQQPAVLAREGRRERDGQLAGERDGGEREKDGERKKDGETDMRRNIYAYIHI